MISKSTEKYFGMERTEKEKRYPNYTLVSKFAIKIIDHMKNFNKKIRLYIQLIYVIVSSSTEQTYHKVLCSTLPLLRRQYVILKPTNIHTLSRTIWYCKERFYKFWIFRVQFHNFLSMSTFLSIKAKCISPNELMVHQPQYVKAWVLVNYTCYLFPGLTNFHNSY